MSHETRRLALGNGLWRADGTLPLVQGSQSPSCYACNGLSHRCKGLTAEKYRAALEALYIAAGFRSLVAPADEEG